MKNIEAAKQVVRTRMLKSVVMINSDEELSVYLRDTVVEVANSYQKNIDDFSVSDIKRAVDSVYEMLKKLNLEEVTLHQVKSFAGHLNTAGDVTNIITFAESIAGIASGNFGWLLWHISKNLAGPRVKRAAAIYIVGHLAASIYGEEPVEIQIKSVALDPIFESMDRNMLVVISQHLNLDDSDKKADNELIFEISDKFKTEGKDQTLLNLRPKDAGSYLEVLIVVAKKKDIDIRGLETVEEIEGVICSTVFNEIWEKLSVEEREALSRKMTSDDAGLAGEYIFSAASAGAIGLAQLSGFGIYSASSALLAFLSGTAGISLGFGAYTGLSSVIAAAIGPAGAIVLLPAIFEYIRAKPEKTLIGAIAAVSIFRSRLIAEGKVINIKKETPKTFSNKDYLIYSLVFICSVLAVLLFYNFKS